MARLINIILLVFSMNWVSAQENNKVVKKKVLFVRHFVGEYRFPKPNGEKLKIGNMALDQRQDIMLPYEVRPDGSHWPFGDYLIDLTRRPYAYFHNEMFLSSLSFDQEYSRVLKEKNMDLVYIDLFKALPVNKTFIREINYGILAKAWIVEAEWVLVTVNKKPTFMGDLIPNTLNYDAYDIFVLKNIISATPVDSTFTGPVARSLEYRTDI